MVTHILGEPTWLQAWVAWMSLLNTLSIIFLRHTPARWILAVWIGNIITMNILFELNGYNRLLGLSHVIWWTPLVIYLARSKAVFQGARPFEIWLSVLFVTNATSLVIDYIDVVRYALGDRS